MYDAEWTEVIRRKYRTLVQNLTRAQDIADELYKEHVLSDEEHVSIYLCSNVYEKNALLLNKIISVNDARLYELFLQQLLSKRQEHLFILLSTSG